MTESTIEKCVAMVCLVALILGGKSIGLDKEMLYTGIAMIGAFTGLGTGTGKITFRKGGKCTEK
jgi:hypothetical protein